MKNILLSIFATNYGTALRFLVALIVGALAALAAKAGFTLSDEQIVGLAGVVATIVSGLIGEYVLKSQGQSIEAMQASLQEVTPAVLVDKWAGPQTIRAVQIAADAMKTFKRRNADANHGPAKSIGTVKSERFTPSNPIQ